MKRFTSFLLSLLFVFVAMAQSENTTLTSLEEGAVYHFQNSGNAEKALYANSNTDVNVTSVDKESYAQQWYVLKEDDYYVLRNLSNGRYLKGAGQNSAWALTDTYSNDGNKFTLYSTGCNSLKTKGTANYGYMHYGEWHNDIIGWSVDAVNSQWDITRIDYDVEELETLLERLPVSAELLAEYQTAVNAIFTDAACTILNSAYTTTSMTDEQLAADANYSALPQTLKNMVKKVRNDEWSEATVDPADRPNGNNSTNVPDSMWTVEDIWDDAYARKFRVQMYEPYSVEGEITSFLGFNAHCNMDNPTGIYANAGETIYIMVEGDIAEGAELWVAHQTGHGVTSYYNNAAYTELKKGLNVITYNSDGCQLWINYLVHTYNTSTGEFPHKLSDYKPLKIHIEGGHINGFFNAMGDFRSTEVTGDANGGENLWGEVDNDADWDYYKARAALATDFALLGHRQTLLFPFGTWDSTNGYFGVANDGGGIEKALAWHLENIEVPTTPNCYAGSGNAFGDFSDTYYPRMNLDAETGKINIMLEAWDRIMYSEHATMGLLSKSNIDKMNSLYPGWTAENTTFDIYNYGSNDTGDTYKAFCEGRDYSDYYNHHGAAVGAASGYMSGGWRVCNYHYNTMGSIIGKIAVEAGPTWGPAHEIGHQHQAIFNLNGQTEVTNNFFSNVAVWYMGMGTSRVNGTSGSLASVLDAFNTEDNDLYTNNIWAITHLYYRLWLYYHLAGNNTQFWPRLFELLRQTPMANGAQISGETSLLRFYQHACDAAGEDLTEFFRAHGFFELMTNRLVGDYSNAIYNVTEEEIGTAIKAVKEKNYPVNYAVLLINDGTSETTLMHDGITERALWDSSASAEYGSVNDFIEGNTSVTEAYTAIVGNDGTVTMSGGEGGVGFLVFNENGELISFSNKSTFELSDEAAYLLATGKATVVAVDTKSNTTEAEVDVTAMRFALLQELIENAIALTQNTSETRVGFYKPSAVENLQDYVTEAQKVIANGDLANLQAVYELLYAEYNAVVANEYSRVTLVPGSKFAILAKSNDRILSYSGSNVVTVAANEDYTSTANNQWYIERDGAYHIKNAGNSKYIQSVTDQNDQLFTVGDEVVNMNINEIALGCYSIATSSVPGRYMNMHGGENAKVITWGDTGDNSQWKFILLDVDDTNAAKEELLELSKKTLALVNEVATVSYNEGSKISLQSSSSTAANYIWSNAAVSGNDVDKLLDSDINTFFHSQWNNSTAPADGWGHHISVDLGTSSTLTSFKFKFTTRNTSNLSNYPKTIEVYGSNVGGNDVANYTRLQVASGFATGAGVDNEAVVMGNGTAYRYLRFLVTDATGNNAGTNTGSDGMVFFHMSEFSIYPVTVSATVKSDYTSGVTEAAVLAAYNDAEQGKTVYNNTDATLDDINAKKTALGDGTAEGSYTTLLNQYNSVLNSVLNAKKAQLLTLITNTNSLIETMGSVVVQGPQKVDLAGKLYAHLPYTAGGTGDSDYSSVENNYNLLDGDVLTHFHSDYSANMPDVPYIRVDLGDGNEVKEFTFNYTTRYTGTGYPTTIKVYGANTQISYDDVKDSEPLATFTTSDANNAMPTSYGSWTSEDIVSETPYRYFVFAVTSSSVTKEYNNVERPYFVMSEFGFTKGGSVDVNLTNTSTKVDEALLLDSYLATTKSQKLHDTATTVALLDAAIADQQAAYDKLDKAIKTPADLDKSGLEELVALAQPLYNKMATDGVVNVDYAPSALTNAQLTAASDALAAANEALASATSQAALDEAKATLQTAYDALLAVENANEKNTITTTDLTTLIEQVETLLGTIATDATDVKATIPLQTTADSDYYIKAFATGDGSVANLIDKNTDGTGVTAGDSYYGSDWDPAPEAFSQYIEVDLGTAIRIDELLFDYTTRDGDQTKERPSAIRISGSNNGVDYTEVTTINEGLATGRCEQWTMTSPLALNRNYRYIRFTVDSERHSFHMSDFNLYALIDKQLKDYYTTATELGFDELCLALQSAKDALSRHYLTTAQYTAIKNKLNSVYNAVNNVIALDYTTRDGLTTLITDTETLINKVATVNGYAKAVQLQCNDASAPNYLYCNAPGGSNNYDTDKAGVAALIDLVDGEPNLSTFIHTTYYGDDYDDDLDHYLRVDAGEGKSILAFKFNYNCRQGYGSNSPKVILIEGTNDLNEEFEEITTLSDLPTDNYASYESALISNGKPYRYIRFMVKETDGDDTHPFFSMSHFGMTSCIDASISEDYPKVTPELLLNAYSEKNSATEAKNHYMPEADYTAAQEALQADYDALLAASKADKTELEELIAATEALKSQLYEITNYTPAKVTLQYEKEDEAGYLYCNAPEKEYASWGDADGVKSCIDLTDSGDPDLTTYLHSDWDGDESEDGLDHYLRVDLGADGAANYIEFKYNARTTDLAPSTILVQACNSLATDSWTDITTLKDLSATTDEVASGCLGNGAEYRYWRFMVIATKKGDKSAGHPYFALTNFEMYTCTNVEIGEQLKYTPTIYIHTTADLVTEVENAITTATGVSEDENVTPAGVETAVDALQAVYDKLEEALKYADVPVAITTDINSPKLYVIYSQRGDSKTDEVWTLNSAKCWQYNLTTNNITIVEGYATDNLYQLWYFTYDDENERYGIVPVMTPGYGIGAKNFEAGASKISAINPNEADGYVTSWALSLSTTIPTGGVYYNFKPDGKNTFLSNYGGGSNPLGFYNTEDEGSRVYFERVDVENFALKRLSKLNEVMGTLGITPAASEIVGEYTIASATTYSEAVETATLMVEGGVSTETEYNEQFVALYQSYENLAINLPVPGTLYTLRSKYRENHYAFVNDDRVARYSNNHIGDDKIDADAIWVFEGTENGSLKLKNLQTGCYVPSLPNKGFSLVADSESAGAVTLHPYGEGDGSLQIQSGSYYFHFNDGTGADQKLIGWEAGGIGGGNPVFIEEVDVEEAIKKISHSVTLGNNTVGEATAYSSLCLGYPVTLPADSESDVKAYIATDVNEDNVIILEPVGGDGKTIPANTPVILKSDGGVTSVEASYSVDVVATVDGAANLLQGSNYTTYIKCLADDGINNVYNVYMLTRKNGVMAMRWMYENYQYVDGVYSKHSNASSDEGGYVQCPANKAYLKFEETATSNLSTEYYFGFFGGTTDIDKVNTGEENPLNGTVYDLQGRKIEEVTVPGFYIVNGKKMYIGSELLK